MRSMTGFGRGSAQGDRWAFHVTLRSVNHRFLDLSLRAPEAVREHEAGLRELLESHLQRGRVEVHVEAEAASTSEGSFDLDTETARRLDALLEQLDEHDRLRPSVTLGDLFRVPGLVRTEDRQRRSLEDSDVVVLKEALATACSGLVEMRETEGLAIRAALERALDQLGTVLEKVSERRAEWTRELEERLRSRLGRLLEDHGLAVDEARLVQESASLTERSDITEELERWQGHIEAARRVVAESGAIGKKLDFLAQEILREVNTVGSKARDLSIAQLVVEAKLAAEALREQIQNVE